MLSIHVLKSAQGATDYYFKAVEYYAGEANTSRWMGSGSQILGLQGVVSKEQMLALLQGHLPSGQSLQNPQGEHRPGFDMTFSACKSVSVLVGLGVAPEMYDIHCNAVAFATREIEKEFAQARVFKDGIIEFKKTGNLTIAGFDHFSSRADDPDMHTHAVTMNLTFADGKPLSLASDIHAENGVVEQLMRNTMYCGLLYRYDSANSLKKIGFTLRSAGDGLFEIAGMPQEVLNTFSSRGQDIKSTMQEKGWMGAKAAAIAALLTREQKTDRPLSELTPEWKDKLQAMGFDPESLKAACLNHIPEKSWTQSMKERIYKTYYSAEETEKRDALECVNVGIEVLSQKTSVFTERELKTEAMKHGLAHERVIGFEALTQAIENEKQANRLYTGLCAITGKQQLTTPYLLSLETETLARIEAGKGQVPAIANKKEVLEFQKQIDSASDRLMTGSQKQAMLSLLTSKDQFLAVQGYAGVAKTTMLATARQMMEEKGYTLRGLTVASSAAEEMQKKGGIKTDVFQVVHAELKRAPQESLQKTIFIVDEASMISSPQGHALVKLVAEKGARLFFVGDRAQLPSVNNGRTFGLAQDYNLQTVVMNEIVRQTKQSAKESVEHATRGEVYDALSKLDAVHEHHTHEERIQQLAQSWLALTPEMRQQTLLFAPSHKNRADVTYILREQLKKEEVLQGQAIILDTLHPHNIAPVQQHFTRYYQEGLVIRFNQNFKRAQISRGDYLTVGQITPEHQRDNVIPLKDEDGKTSLFPLKLLPEYKKETAGFERVIEVYEPRQLEVQKGETVLWNKNFKRDGILNSERATLTAIKDTHFEFISEKGQSLTLDKTHAALKHIDHGYVLTNYKVQGKDKYQGMGLLESNSKFSATLQNFYVQISRAVYSMKLVTDDKTNLVRALEYNIDEKKTAIDAVSREKVQQHAVNFNPQTSLPMDLIFAKKSERDTHWQKLEKTAANFQDSIKNQSSARAAQYAHTLLSSQDGMRLARARMGFGFQTYRTHAMKIESLRLMKTLSAEEQASFKAVARYVELNSQVGKAWQSAGDKSMMSEIAKETALLRSAKRDEAAYFITQNLNTCKPFLKHFSIGELNRFGVPQHKYDEQGARATQKLERLSGQSVRHQVFLHVREFLNEQDTIKKERLASLIVGEAKIAHPHILNLAKETGQESKALWQAVRHANREFEDKQFKSTLKPEQQAFFDKVKQYKTHAIESAMSWKQVFAVMEDGQKPPQATQASAQNLGELRNALALEILKKQINHQPVMDYFKLNPEKLTQHANQHTRIELVQRLTDKTCNIQQKLACARLISEDIKGYYPILKSQNADLKQVKQLLRVAERQETLAELTAPERQQYKTVIDYQLTSRKTGRAWKDFFNSEGDQNAKAKLRGHALRLGAERDALAHKINNLDAFSLALKKENIAIDRLQEHGKNHQIRLREVHQLQQEQHGLLSQLKTNNMQPTHVKNWRQQWVQTSRQIQYVSKDASFQTVMKETPIKIEMPEQAQTMLEVLTEKRPAQQKNPIPEKSHVAFSVLSASSINDALMARPEETYKNIFGEPKKISGKVMDYPNGLKVTLQGKNAGLWYHFSDMQGGAPIQAIMYANGVNFKEALKIGAAMSGLDNQHAITPVQYEKEKALSQDVFNTQRIQSAQSIWKSTKPLTGTLAETYLQKHRGITDTKGLLDMRFWPVSAAWQKLDEQGKLIEAKNKLPALVIAARNEKNEIIAVQRIYLDKDTASKNKFLQEAKLSCGMMKGASALIQKGSSKGTLYIAEGPETGASIARAVPDAAVLVSFGVNNMANLSGIIQKTNSKHVIIAADYDAKIKGQAAPSTVSTEKSAQVMRDHGFDVKTIYPKAIEGLKKTDWNDVLIRQGIGEIQKQLGLTQTQNKPDMPIDKRMDFKPLEKTAAMPMKFLERPKVSSSFILPQNSGDAGIKISNLSALKIQNINLPDSSLSLPDQHTLSREKQTEMPFKVPEKIKIKEMEI